MELISNNPYRIAGVLSNANARELARQKTKMTAFAKVGKEIKSEYDFDNLGNISRSDTELVENAFSSIEQNHNRVNHALFWFLNVNAFDNTAIEYLKAGNTEKATDIWEKVTEGRDINSKNFSSFNNLGTLKLLSEDKDDIKGGIEAKVKLIESDLFKDFVHTVADETYVIAKDKQIEKFIDDLLIHFNNEYSREETIELFKNCNGSAQSYLVRKFTDDPIYKIEKQIVNTKTERKENKSDLYRIGLNLYLHCKDDLSFLKSLLGVNDLRLQSIADQLANEIMQCSIDYFNEGHKKNSNGNFFESTQELIKIADSIAVGKLTKDRTRDSLTTLEEIQNKEILQIIAVLESIIDAYKNLPKGQSINNEIVKEILEKTITDQSIKMIAVCNDYKMLNKCTDLVGIVSGRLGGGNYGSYDFLKQYYAELNHIRINRGKEQIRQIIEEKTKKESTNPHLIVIRAILTLLISDDYGWYVSDSILKEDIPDDILIKIAQCDNESLLNEFYNYAAKNGNFRVRVENVFVTKLPVNSVIRKGIERKKEEKKRKSVEERRKREIEKRQKEEAKSKAIKKNNTEIICFVIILIAIATAIVILWGGEILVVIGLLFGVPFILGFLKNL